MREAAGDQTPPDITEEIRQFGGSPAAGGTDDRLTGQEENDLEALLDNFKENVPARTLNPQDTPVVDAGTGVPASESAMAFV